MRSKGLALCLAGTFAVVGAIAFPFLAPGTAAAVAAGLAVSAGTGLWLLLKLAARKQSMRLGRRLGEHLATAEAAGERLREQARRDFDTERARLAEHHTLSRKKSDEHFRPLMEQQKRHYEAEMKRINAEHATRTASLQTQHMESQKSAERSLAESQTQIVERYQSELAAAEAAFEARAGDAARTRDAVWERTASHWRQALTETHAELLFLRSEGDRLFPDWADAANAALPSAVPEGVPFGTIEINLNALPEGMSDDERLRPDEPFKLSLPAYLPFPDRCSVVLKARDEGRAAAVAALQAHDAPFPDRPAAGQGAVHHRRSRSGSARTSPPSCTWPTTTRSS